MDFDEIDYLEKTVENPEVSKEKERERANGGDDDVANNNKSSEKDRRSSRRSRSDHHNNEKEDDHLDHRSKRPRSRDDTDRDRHRERRRDRDRDVDRSEKDKERRRSSRDRDRDRDRDREERNGRERDGDRDKERERRRERGRELELEKEKEVEQAQRRSRSRSERRDKDVELERDREKSREREIRERELRERDRESRYTRAIFRGSFWHLSQAQDIRRYKEKKEEVEPEADPERDQRTVFAYQISLKADEKDVFQFFSRAGKVRDVRLIMDRNSRRSKGVGYIEFYDVMSVPMAIALSGQLLLGLPVMVKPSEAEKNLVQSTTAVVGPGGSIGPYSGGARRLYVGNLHFNITEDQLRQVFEPFGAVELVQLPLDESGHCKGFGFVQFARLEDARNAQNLNGQLDIAGRTIKVSAVSDQVGMQEIGVNAGDFDDDDGGGMSLNARSRAILMQKLDRSGVVSSITGSMVTPVLNGSGLPLATATVPGMPSTIPIVPQLGQTTLPTLTGLPGSSFGVPTVTATSIDPIGIPSECLLLKDMFDPSIETEPDFDLDIKEDVQAECSKFGLVKHIYVDKHSAGFVYLQFDNTQSAMNAQRALHGRWFAGKMITASYMVPQNYEAKFPDCI
ncbi:hypothetical protein IFM89_001918 [Coptis chinensis]|uniref:RRM domain-containing protein n=1 Tax=Coptis chinensis TaxID=261450 RepID=A0A835M6T0_9MAGN|nr:hypothetical protein IFM89_001918 [Coptis chinensis]